MIQLDFIVASASQTNCQHYLRIVKAEQKFMFNEKALGFDLGNYRYLV